jgi:hypothetical protein
VKFIPAVTVEIPAVPEDFSRLKKAANELDDAGVKYLNLHQIRATPYNCRKLIERDYTFVPGPHPAVFESELAALEAMLYIAEAGLGISVNYCSYIYRSRYQARAAAARFAYAAAKGFESVTERGFIRRLEICGDNHKINDIAMVLRKSGVSPDLWSVSESGSEIYFHPSILDRLASEKLQLGITYEQIIPSENKSGPCDSAFRLGAGMELSLRRKPLFSAVLEGADKEKFIAGFVKNADGIFVPTFEAGLENSASKLNELEDYELIPAGMQDYTED